MNWTVVAAAAGAVLSCIAIIAVFWRLITFLSRVSLLYPVIMDMAKQFKSDSGSSLKDQVNKLERAATDNAAAAKIAKAAADEAKVAAVIQTALLDTIRAELGRKL